MNDLNPDIDLNLGSSVTVTDPCYIPGSLGHMAIEIDVSPGFWTPYMEYDDVEGRVSTLGITKNGFGGHGRVVGYAGVDSGQMMIIDSDAIDEWNSNDDDQWPFGTGANPETPEESVEPLSYYGACELTLGPEQGGVLDEVAVVSSSGYGDGSYPVYVFEGDSGQVERIEIRFIEEEDEWDDNWDDEDEEPEAW